MFEPTTVLSLGPAHLGISLLGYAAGMIAALGWYAVQSKKDNEPWAKAFVDGLTGAVLIYLLIYKFWPIVEDPRILLSPASLFLYAGGAYAKEAGMLGAGAWIVFRAIRGKWFHWLALEWLLVGYVIFAAVDNLLVKEYGIPTGGFGFELSGTRYVPLNLVVGGALVILFILYARGFHKRLRHPRERVGAMLVGICFIALAKGMWSVGGEQILLWGLSGRDIAMVAGIVIGGTLILLPKNAYEHSDRKRPSR